MLIELIQVLSVVFKLGSCLAGAVTPHQHLSLCIYIFVYLFHLFGDNEVP